VPGLFTSGVQPDAIRPAGAVPWVHDSEFATAVITAPAGVTAEKFRDVEVIGGCGPDGRSRLVQRCKVLISLQGAHPKRMSILQVG
jgi:hypothetical protein